MLDYRVRTFLTVCETMNYTQAAHRLNITQPAVSQHIRCLEAAYHIRLFLYEGKQLTLTRAGEILRRRLTALENDERALRAELSSLPAGIEELSLGVTMTIGEYAIVQPLARLLAAHPELNIHLRFANTQQLLHLLDAGRIQLFVNAKACGDDAFAAFQLLDLGDHVGCEGELFVTRTGELSIRIASWTLLAKALRQPPEKFHGLTDTEDRYRRRYVDLFSSPESRERFYKRSAILRETRRWLEARGFMEVETPILQPHAGGATAKPFTTHYNALDREMFLRIAPELYLKRLIIGGFDKVFEIGRDFRNEGLDRTHNPEFTVLELYQAYGDRRSMMDVIEGLLPHLCDTVIGSRRVKYGEHELDFTPPYREVAYADIDKSIEKIFKIYKGGRIDRDALYPYTEEYTSYDGKTQECYGNLWITTVEGTSCRIDITRCYKNGDFKDNVGMTYFSISDGETYDSFTIR